jgi:uncharacterized OsmC-like protein
LKITLLSEDRIRLDGEAGPMTIEAPSAEMTYSPFHMLASGLATCTLSVLHAWATNAKVPADDLGVEVGWMFAEDPHRVGEIEVDILWPSLPENRKAAAARVADLCTIKVTLKQPPEVRTEVKTAAEAAA